MNDLKLEQINQQLIVKRRARPQISRVRCHPILVH